MANSRNRSRIKSGTYTWAYPDRWGNYSSIGSYTYQKSEILKDSLPGPGACDHQKPGVLSGTFIREPRYQAGKPHWDSFAQYPFGFDNLNFEWSSSLKNVLNWEKLPSSSEFGLIQIFAELDETVALFSKRLFEELSYGQFTWGIVPLISDLKAIGNAVKNLTSDLSKVPYEDQYQGSFKKTTDTTFNTGNWSTVEYQVEYKIRFSGSVDYSFQHPGSILLDRLGFHPDLSTMWDLIPFSFVVDYLFPIGDYLQTFRQGGWIKACLFTGWSTYKANVTSITRLQPSSDGLRRQSLLSEPASSFTRSNQGVILTVPSESTLDIETPSLKEMFNILYLVTRPKW